MPMPVAASITAAGTCRRPDAVPCTIGSSAYSVSAITAGSRPMPWMPQPGHAARASQRRDQQGEQRDRRHRLDDVERGEQAAARAAPARRGHAQRHAEQQRRQQRGADDLQMAPQRGVEHVLPVAHTPSAATARRVPLPPAAAPAAPAAAHGQRAPPPASARRCNASAARPGQQQRQPEAAAERDPRQGRQLCRALRRRGTGQRHQGRQQRRGGHRGGDVQRRPGRHEAAATSSTAGASSPTRRLPAAQRAARPGPTPGGSAPRSGRPGPARPPTAPRPAAPAPVAHEARLAAGPRCDASAGVT